MQVEVVDMYYSDIREGKLIIETVINGEHPLEFIIKDIDDGLKLTWPAWRVYGGPSRTRAELKGIENKVIRAYIEKMVEFAIKRCNL